MASRLCTLLAMLAVSMQGANGLTCNAGIVTGNSTQSFNILQKFKRMFYALNYEIGNKKRMHFGYLFAISNKVTLPEKPRP